ncbi:phage tail sheath family protein [Fusobacterium hominis]|uniref:phage tail sheath family protein n=1 Tax=Fusobacterium hominis TaxID=2764326 RepID=UPI002107DC03|nr:phage tail protein [Fusobacterium hominis]
MFTHGTYSKELESKIKGIITTKTPVVVLGTAPINMGEIDNVNKINLIQSAKDVVKFMGTTQKVEGFTLTEAAYVGLNIFGVTPFILINVLDPEKHKTKKSFEQVVVKDEKIILEEPGILLKSLTIKNNSDSTPIKEFESSFLEDGTLEITFGHGVNATKIDGEFEYLDPSKVEASDLIGSCDPQSLKNTGLEVLKEIFPKYSMIPSYVITPGYTDDELRAILDTKASKIGNKWQSMSIFELPETTKYGEAIEYKKSHNWIDEDQIIVFGKVKFGNEYYNHSIFHAFLSASVDARNEGVPYESASNKNIKAACIGYKEKEKYIDLHLTEEEANLLNENGIVTIISRPNGVVAWGNRTSVFQPGGNTDPKDMWTVAKRMFKFLANALMLNNENEVDKPMSVSRAEAIKMNANRYLASLVAQEKLLGASVDFKKEENNKNDLVNGVFTWHISLGIVLPGETLKFVLEYNDEYLDSYF